MENQVNVVEEGASSPLPWELAKKESSTFTDRFADMEQASTGTDVDENTPWGKAIAESRQKPIYAPPEQKSVFDMSKYVRKLASTESSNDPNAKAKSSTATGMYQFLSGTWNEWVDKLGLDYTLEDRKDPKKAEVVLKAFTEENRKKAESVLGREPNMVETYMYHLLGNASKFLSAPDDAPATELATPLQVKKNKAVFYKKNGEPRTKGEVLSMFERKFGG